MKILKIYFKFNANFYNNSGKYLKLCIKNSKPYSYILFLLKKLFLMFFLKINKNDKLIFKISKFDGKYNFNN